MQPHKIVSRDEWIAARKAFLAREKELTHLNDRVAEERRALPWVKVDKDYVFRRDRTAGRRWPTSSTGRSQLHRLPLHVRPRLGGRLPRLLVPLPTTSTAPTSTSRITTCRSSRCRARL